MANTDLVRETALHVHVQLEHLIVVSAEEHDISREELIDATSNRPEVHLAVIPDKKKSMEVSCLVWAKRMFMVCTCHPSLEVSLKCVIKSDRAYSRPRVISGAR